LDGLIDLPLAAFVDAAKDIIPGDVGIVG